VSDNEIELRRVFEPFRLKHLELRNRVVRTSQGAGFSVDGKVSDDTMAYTIARARGGMALIFTEPGATHWSAPGNLDNTTDDVVPGLRRLSNAVHAEGALLFQQLIHYSSATVPLDGSAPWAASSVPYPGLGMLPLAMTKGMIDEVIEGCASAARRTRDGGLDGVELSGGHGYLFGNFLSPATNHRTDEYGGQIENRMRLLFETLAAIRTAVGPEFVVGVRLSSDAVPGHTTMDDIALVAIELEASGLVDYINMSYGGHYRRDVTMAGTHEPRAHQVPVWQDVAARLTLPRMIAGRVATLYDAERVLESGVAQMVSMVRATIADPDVVVKAQRGRIADTRPCIYTNQACAGGLNARGRVSCTVNPAAGRERSWSDDAIVRTDSPRHVVIVGGGVGGLEASRVASLAGHRVTLLEQSAALGGQLRLAAKSPLRSEITRLIPWYERTIRSQGVDVRLGERATAAGVLGLQPDLVVVATGAVPRRDAFQTWLPERILPGLGDIELLTSWDVLREAPLGESVLIVDEIGHYEPLDVAEYVLAAGRKVHFVTRFATMASNLETRFDMIGRAHTKYLLERDFDLYTRSLVLEVAPDRATIANVDARHRTTSLEVDTFVFLSGNLPQRELLDELEDAGVRAKAIGDANGPRMLEAAILEGYMAARSLEPSWVTPKGLRYGVLASAT
jgi:2,4-dienoyl-CoA reductase-like NADH-dependent reductase (Old Yellow Enzyme family)/pyruvate/2-oxoglutarate dehydrogenase complex dihydrolipoamide dehydrogenase (E3) component